MPYNLRKRKAPEPVEEVAEVKKPRGRAKKVTVEKVTVDNDKQSDIVNDKKPVIAVDKKPVIAVDKKPVISKDKKPAAVKKTTVVKANKTTFVEAKDATFVKAKKTKPIVIVDQKADTSSDQEPAEAEPEPIAEAELEPDAEAGPEPIAEAEPEPIAEAEPEPIAEAEPEPIAKTESKPSDVVSKPADADDGCHLYIFGYDSCGEFGLGKMGFPKKTPTLVPIGHRVRQVACGPQHTVALSTAGDVYSFGCNDEAALGRVTESDEEESTPTLVPLNHKIVKITAGDSHSAALSDDNKVFIWGNFRDEHGSIGLLPECDGQKTYKPIQVSPEIEFKDIASGANHMLLLDTKGIVYSFGVGSVGQLGRLEEDQVEFEENRAREINAENRELFLRPAPVSFSNVDPQRQFICDAIFAGEYTSFATNTDKKKNRLAAWGLNNYHQLGYKGQKPNQTRQLIPRRSTFTCSTSMVQVACGQHHTLFLTKSGRLYVAGKTMYGLLGIGEPKSPSVCPAKFIEQLGNSVVTIAATTNASFAVTDEGKLYSWGVNENNNLGCDSENDLMVPTEATRLKDKKVVSVSAGSTITAVLIE